MERVRTTCSSCLLLLLMIVSTDFGTLTVFADWPQFLGKDRNGVSEETGLIDSFPSSGPELVWRVQGGVGMSAIAVSGKYAVTMWNAKGKQFVAALDSQTGKQIWETSVGTEYKNSMGDGPRATPTIDGDVVYVFTGEGILCAMALKSGDLLWQTDTVGQHHTKPSEYGMASSPLVVDAQVIVQVGGRNAAVVAYDKSDGKKRWTAGDATAAYSSPVLLSVAGEQHIVCMTGFGAHGLHPESGSELWSFPFKTPYDCNTASPLSVDGGVFISSGENHGSVMLNVTKQGQVYKVTEKWASVDTKSVMRNEWQTSVLKDGMLFGFDNVGSAGPTTHLTCIDAETGERIWQKTRFGKGNLVLADGKLWITMMNGDLVLVAASRDGFHEVSRSKLFGKTRQSLSIANGLGYIRDDKHVLCFRLKKQ